MAYRILFHTANKPDFTRGGTERTSITLAESLTVLYGCKCFSTYVNISEAPKEKCFIKDFCIGIQRRSDKLINLVNKYKIDFVIDQGDFELITGIDRSLLTYQTKFIFAHHFEPGWEANFISTDSIKSEINSTKGLIKIKKYIKFILYELFIEKKRLRKLPIQYKMAYKNADKVVVLCKDYVKAFSDYGEINNTTKFEVISNALSFDEFISVEKLNKKEKRVLIVSRMEETQKRIILALEIWEKAKKYSDANGWFLDIVGDGPDLERYNTIIKNRKIKDVKLWGRQNPITFYEKASIFMMTSVSEGWGITLTEAQQNGVIPIVFDTCAPFREIIINEEDNYNGKIITEGKIDKYVSELNKLMCNKSMRTLMAKNCINSAKRFSKEIIAAKWMLLFDSIKVK